MRVFTGFCLSWLVLLAGCSEESSVANSSVTDRARKAAEKGRVDPEIMALIDGLDMPDLDESASRIVSGFRRSPSSREAATQYVWMFMQFGLWQEDAGQTRIAETAFARAEKALAEVLDAGGSVEPSIAGGVWFKSAGRASATGNTQAAVASLEKAVESGFDAIDEIQRDDSLAAVRQLPEFADHFERWKAAAAGRLLAQARADLAAGETFPFDFALLNIQGDPVKLADFQGNVCVVDIWGTWCGPCRMEIPSFIRLQSDYGDQGLRMVGLNAQESGSYAQQTATVTEAVKGMGINYPCAIATPEVLAQVPNMRGFPTTLFIDRRGAVRMRTEGVRDHNYLNAVVQALLEESVN